MKATGVSNGIVLYIQKDNLQTCAFETEYDAEKGDEIIKRFEKIHHSLINNQMPEPEAKQDETKSWMCDYCAWKGECGEE